MGRWPLQLDRAANLRDPRTNNFRPLRQQRRDTDPFARCDWLYDLAD